MKVQERAEGTYSVVATIVYGMTFKSSLGIVGSYRVWVLYQCLKQGKRGFPKQYNAAKVAEHNQTLAKTCFCKYRLLQILDVDEQHRSPQLTAECAGMYGLQSKT